MIRTSAAIFAATIATSTTMAINIETSKGKKVTFNPVEEYSTSDAQQPQPEDEFELTDFDLENMKTMYCYCKYLEPIPENQTFKGFKMPLPKFNPRKSNLANKNKETKEHGRWAWYEE